MTQTAGAVPQQSKMPAGVSENAVWQLSPQVFRVPRLLGEDLAGMLLDRAVSVAREEMIPSRVRNDQLDLSTRRSHSYHGFRAPELIEVLDTLHERLEQVLGVPCRETRPRYSLNVHNDGDFYHPHQDVSPRVSEKVAREGRVLTFVYYLHRTPRPFTGGALRIYDAAAPARPEGALTAANCTYRDWSPDHDSVIFFRPSTLHEVRPVVCPSGDHADSRFAINGWLCRPAIS